MLSYQKVSCFASFEISSCICATKILLILHVLFSNGDYFLCADKYQPDLTKICILEIDWFKHQGELCFRILMYKIYINTGAS